jgi:hypothetical protein
MGTAFASAGAGGKGATWVEERGGIGDSPLAMILGFIVGFLSTNC